MGIPNTIGMVTKILRFEYGPKGHFFVRAKGTEKDIICYSDYKRVFISSMIGSLLIKGDSFKGVTHEMEMEMGTS